jgi:hypothetical protein
MGHGVCERKVFMGIDAIESSAKNSAGFAEWGLQGRTVCRPINAPR